MLTELIDYWRCVFVFNRTRISFILVFLRRRTKNHNSPLEKYILVKGKIRSCGFRSFSHIRMMGYSRLGQVRVNECPSGLESPRELQKYRRTLTVKIRRNPPLPLIRISLTITHILHYYPPFSDVHARLYLPY